MEPVIFQLVFGRQLGGGGRGDGLSVVGSRIRIRRGLPPSSLFQPLGPVITDGRILGVNDGHPTFLGEAFEDTIDDPCLIWYTRRIADGYDLTIVSRDVHVTDGISRDDSPSLNDCINCHGL